MAGSYYEKEKSYSQSNGTSVSTSFKQQQVLRPEDLNQLGEDERPELFFCTDAGLAVAVVDDKESKRIYGLSG